MPIVEENEHWFTFMFINPFTDEEVTFSKFCRLRKEYIEERIEELHEINRRCGVLDIDICHRTHPATIAEYDANDIFKIPDDYVFDDTGTHLKHFEA